MAGKGGNGAGVIDQRLLRDEAALIMDAVARIARITDEVSEGADVQVRSLDGALSGLNQMAFTIAAELLKHRINVNVIEPGWIDTPNEHATFGSDVLRKAAPTLPWGRLGTPEDIGRAAVFLCSDDADYITGTELVVDGGLCLRGAGGASATERPK